MLEENGRWGWRWEKPYGKFIGASGSTHLSACCAEPEPAGFRLLNAFSHFVFIDGAVAAENLRSFRGDVGSTLLTNRSFCREGERGRGENKKDVH